MPTIFLPLTPQGLGTCDIEALDSYLLRLAAEHGVSEYQFYRVLAHWWNQSIAQEDHPLGRHVAYITKIGHGKDIDALVRAIEHGTGFSGLSGMTLSAFRDVSGTHVGDIVRKIHQWCPACLREWDKAGAPIYEKLLWRLTPITRCAIHKLALQDRCPACNSYQLRHEDTWPRCFSCGEHLAADARLWRRTPRPSEGESDLSEVVEYCATHSDEPFDGNAARDFLRLIRKNWRQPRGIATDFHLREKPSRTLISALLNLARETHVPLLSILLNPSEASAIRPLIEGKSGHITHPRRRKLSHSDRRALRKDLLLSTRQGHTAPSLHQICRKHGCSPTVARYWYPDFVQAVLAARRAQKSDLIRNYAQRLDGIRLDDAMVSKASVAGWHQVTRDIALHLDIPIRLIRKRITMLRGDPSLAYRSTEP
ncbi:TniQ family protein [Dyella sp. Tek66A03]|uniref:TniQ family protein n=1 Tax=Dyella sp. Tek66A03 TaxID=3458298 RepID=UPI00403E5352